MAMYTLEDCKKEWEKTGKYGTPTERIERNKLWMPYYSFIAQQMLKTSYTKNEGVCEILRFLTGEKALNKSDTVLDIGAGNGRYTLELAQLCSAVTAIDMNGTSLSVIRKYAKEIGLSNITTLAKSWEEYDTDEKYDFILSSMCPAICNIDEILKMENMCKRTCCLVAVGRGSYEKVRQDIMKLLPIKKISGMTTEALQYYNILYLMGRQVNVKTCSQHFEYAQTLEGLLNQYPIYFKIFGVDESTSKSVITQYFNTHSENGVLKDECQLNYSLLYWNVNKK
jgi:16S rRNA G527 N7-methylase RsmG